jgi:hypothetical protein
MISITYHLMDAIQIVTLKKDIYAHMQEMLRILA